MEGSLTTALGSAFMKQRGAVLLLTADQTSPAKIKAGAACTHVCTHTHTPTVRDSGRATRRLTFRTRSVTGDCASVSDGTTQHTGFTLG